MWHILRYETYVNNHLNGFRDRFKQFSVYYEIKDNIQPW